jgi:hypothetical protein
MILGVEKGNARSHSMENSLWKRLWNCRKVDHGLNGLRGSCRDWGGYSQPVTVETRTRFQARTSCATCGGRSGTGMIFLGFLLLASSHQTSTLIHLPPTDCIILAIDSVVKRRTF